EYMLRSSSARRPAEPTAASEENGAGPAVVGLADEANWQGAEKKLIMEALLRCKGNRGEAAKVLGWGRSTLWRKIKQHGIG
ncbi:MAG TPA: helix-turn-helix domain-containing protein, partial [Desulfurivibrionaceae bacterium]|nr:helix-turn-helix domain-containing protein [Desulfurivibrionaceae bacterium]